MLDFIGNKRGNMQDLIIIMVLLFTVVAVTVIAFKLYGELSTELYPQLDKSTINTEVDDNVTTAFGVFDSMFAVLVVGLVISAIVGAFLLDTHPVFFWVSLIILILVIVMGALIANATTDLLGSPEITSTYDQFPIMKFFFNHLPLNMLVIGMLIALALYVKRGDISI